MSESITKMAALAQEEGRNDPQQQQPPQLPQLPQPQPQEPEPNREGDNSNNNNTPYNTTPCKSRMLTWKILGAVLALVVVLGWVFIIVMLILEEKWQLVLVAWLLLYSAAHFCYWYCKRHKLITLHRQIRLRVLGRRRSGRSGSDASGGKTDDSPPSYLEAVTMPEEPPPPPYFTLSTPPLDPHHTQREGGAVPPAYVNTVNEREGVNAPPVYISREGDSTGERGEGVSAPPVYISSEGVNAPPVYINREGGSTGEREEGVNAPPAYINTISEVVSSGYQPSSAGRLSPRGYHTPNSLRKLSPRVLPSYGLQRCPSDSAVTATAAATAAATIAAALTRVASTSEVSSPSKVSFYIDSEDEEAEEDPIRGPILKHLRSTHIATLEVQSLGSSTPAIPYINPEEVEDLQTQYHSFP